MELILKSSEINLPQEIENLAALKAELTPKLEKYNNLVVTADSIKAAKADKAALNKLRAAIEDQRKAIKRQYLEPYNILESQCKEVVALIDAPIQVIDKQIKAYDEIEEQEKYTELQEAFVNLDPPDWIELADVLNPKWKNKTAKTDALISEIEQAVKELTSGLEKVKATYGEEPFLLSVLEFYKEHKDFSKTAVYAAQLNTAYKREQEAKLKAQKLAEEAAQRESFQNEPQRPAPVNNESIQAEPQKGQETQSEKPQKLFKGKFEVEGTAEQIKALGQYMKANNIKFTIIKEG
jgi:hypothetical protein